MYILHFTGKGQKMMAGVSEYIILSEEKYSEEEIKSNTAPGFTLQRQYDTDTDSDVVILPLDRGLIPIY